MSTKREEKEKLAARLINDRTYVLKHDVENPNLDRRKTRDEECIPWTKGDRFRARVWMEDLDGAVPPYPRSELRVLYMDKMAGMQFGRIGDNTDGYDELTLALELQAVDLGDVLAEFKLSDDRGPEMVLEELFDSRLITPDLVRLACAAIHKKWDAEQDAEDAEAIARNA